MPICATLTSASIKIAPSTVYAARTRPPSRRAKRDEVLKDAIRTVHAENYSALGARKMHVMLNRPLVAERHGQGHVARCTTRPAPREQCPADIEDRHFSAFQPNELWVADITYVRTFSGWVYVAFARRRELTPDRGLVDLHQPVHRPRPRT